MAQPTPMQAFQAASAVDPATLREIIVATTVAAALGWGALYLRKALTHGWRELNLLHAGMGLFLVLILAFFVFWVTAHYGTGP